MVSTGAKQPKARAMYETPEAQQLTRLLQEATRATPASGPETYVAPSGGDRAEANYHHFVFGQRGSGKSSLLRHLQSQMTNAGRVGVWIDQEIYSKLSYPDVLVSVLHELMKSLAITLDARISEISRPRRFRLSIKKRPRTVEEMLLDELRSAGTELERLKFAPLNRTIEWKIVSEAEQNAKASGGVRMELVSLQAELGSEDRSSTTASETVKGDKEEYLERALTGYRDLIIRTSALVGGGFVFVDDLYQIRRDDQPEVLGYLHRLVKDTGLWLKVGSIRYSTMTFRPGNLGNPPRGMQSGHDAHDVPLDRGLRHPQVAQAFLEKILSRIGQKANIDIYELITENARQRLVIAAGGVARDYLRITAGAIDEARNRGVTDKDGSHRIIVDDINKAAALLSPAKFDDLKADEPTEAAELADLVRRLTEFCRAQKRAYFLIAADAAKLSDQVNKLQHLRFAHLLAESETVPDEASKRFNVWLLDVAELSSQRATPGMDFLGWAEREKRRTRALIFTGEEDATARAEKSGRNRGPKKARPTSPKPEPKKPEPKKPEPKKPEPKKDDTLF